MRNKEKKKKIEEITQFEVKEAERKEYFVSYRHRNRRRRRRRRRKMWWWWWW